MVVQFLCHASFHRYSVPDPTVHRELRAVSSGRQVCWYQALWFMNILLLVGIYLRTTDRRELTGIGSNENRGRGEAEETAALQIGQLEIGSNVTTSKMVTCIT